MPLCTPRLASEWYCSCSFITHSNEQKKVCLGLRPEGLINILLSLSWTVSLNALNDDIHSFLFLLPVCMKPAGLGCSLVAQWGFENGLDGLSSPSRAVLMCGYPIRLYEYYLMSTSWQWRCSCFWGRVECQILLCATVTVCHLNSACFFDPVPGSLHWVMLSFCPPTWPKFCCASPLAMVLNAKLAEMTQLTSTLICWLEICVRNRTHL